MAEHDSKSLALKTWPMLKEVNNKYNFEIAAAIDQGKPIVIASAMCPQQLQGAFDVTWVTGEWYGCHMWFYSRCWPVRDRGKMRFPA